MAVTIASDKSSVLRAAPRLMQVLRVLARHGFLRAMLGRRHWPSPKEVREAFEDLKLVFVKFGQVLAMRRGLLPVAYVEELALLHDDLPAMGIGAVRATVEVELGEHGVSAAHGQAGLRWQNQSIAAKGRTKASTRKEIAP